jgi:hypothetical protein
MKKPFLLAVLMAGLLLLGCTGSKQSYVCPDSSVVDNPANCPKASVSGKEGIANQTPQNNQTKLSTEELVKEYNARFEKVNDDITKFASLGNEATQIISEYNSGHSYEAYKKYLEFGARYAQFMLGAKGRAADFESFIASNGPELKLSLDTGKVLSQLGEARASYKQLTIAINTNLESMSSDIGLRVGIQAPEKTQREELAKELAELANS